MGSVVTDVHGWEVGSEALLLVPMVAKECLSQVSLAALPTAALAGSGDSGLWRYHWFITLLKIQIELYHTSTLFVQFFLSTLRVGC